jgi:hypothetical protein
MKFRRLGCNCCKIDGATRQCKSPTYVLSEVVDDSNVIFLLITKAERTSCGGPLAIRGNPAEQDARAFPSEQGGGESLGFSPGRRAQAINGSCSHPSFRPAPDDDFERRWGPSPGRRGLRLVEEALVLRPDRMARFEAEEAAPADA